MSSETNLTDAALEADIRVEQSVHRRNPGIHNGEETVRAAKGGAGGHISSSSIDEELPLLEASGEEDGAPREALWSGMEDFEGLPWWKRPSVFWMLLPFLFSTIAFGGIAVPKLQLVLNLICREVLADRSVNDPGFVLVPVVFGAENPQCRVPEVQARVAQFSLFGNLISGILSAIASPKLGALSDRYGRKRIIAITNIGMLSGEIITIFAATYPETFHVNWILVGFFFDGICGSFIAAMALAHSYATDCTPPYKRNVAFGYFHGCLFTGIAVGPIIAGYIIKATGDVRSMFYIALGSHIMFILFLGFIIPESLSKKRQQAAREKHKREKERFAPATDWINQLRQFNLLEPLKILFPKGPGSSPAVRRNLILLSAVDTIMFGVGMGAISVIIIYVDFMFGWGTFEASKFVSIVNSCRVVCLLVILPLITRIVRGKASTRPQRNTGSDNFELYLIRTSIVFDTVGFLGYTLSREGRWFILSGAIASIGGMGSPTLQSALTKHVPPDQTGQLLGATGLLHALARVIAPTIFNALYSVTVGKFTQAVFVLLTATFAVAFGFSLFVRPHVYIEVPESSPERENEDGRVTEHSDADDVPII
ncbi:MFS general substrate transporter [Aulographum hederae CBS 113979]|uniref:MFS general substrate transporter n=1 Tax=Aulographum hederae CBS 113979 TaxID=1176131 RepID=A0A6G1H4I1_9PEZI|nr:MFS general substrate transporter [Aulographum hederae CBS 113979]